MFRTKLPSNHRTATVVSGSVSLSNIKQRFILILNINKQIYKQKLHHYIMFFFFLFLNSLKKFAPAKRNTLSHTKLLVSWNNTTQFPIQATMFKMNLQPPFSGCPSDTKSKSTDIKIMYIKSCQVINRHN
jgi:hypothetical protein